jgi:hypothetical protein
VGVVAAVGGAVVGEGEGDGELAEGRDGESWWWHVCGLAG